jgi:hypothetical protein
MRRALVGLAAGIALVACCPGVASASTATWTAQAVPLPSGATVGSLGGVSCTSASSCTAVGAYGTSAATGVDSLLAERWDGSRWTAGAVPQPSGGSGAHLSAVSCASATSCVAVGSYTVSSTQVETPLALSWNGSSWTAEDAVAPPSDYGAGLDGVSCTSANSCIAVGSWLTGTTQDTLAEYWNGRTWTLQTSPSPNRSLEAELSGVSCVTAANCTAVGSYYGEEPSGPYARKVLTEHWNGSSWARRIAVVPADGGNDSQLTGVSCGATDGCTAVGYYSSTTTAAYIPMAEHWNGHLWALQGVPEPAGTSQNAELYGVSCASAASCLAVGRWGNTALAEHYNGHAWNVQETANPIGMKIFNAVSCVSTTTCTVVGSSRPTKNVLLPAAEQS